MGKGGNVKAPIINAFFLGIISACSFPLGAITSAYWKPTDRALAFLLAFGGGALLAALTIDLVGSALDKGHFAVLACGCLVGAAIFISLNQLVNERGGFLRKTSTAVYYLQRREQRKLKRALAHLGRIDIFRNLPQAEIEALATSAFSRDYEKGAMFFRQHDPSTHLYIVEKGEVHLLDPQDNMRLHLALKPHDAFGRLGFFTGSPRTTPAVAVTDTRVWLLPRQGFDRLLRTSTTLSESLQQFLRSEEVAVYLHRRQGMTAQQIQAWVEDAICSIRSQGVIRSAVEVERNRRQFRDALTQISRAPIFQHLPAEDVEEIASQVFSQRVEKGYTFFHQNEQADRMYIIEHGEVALLDPKDQTRVPITLGENDAFGSLSFLTDSHHTVTAVATMDTVAWVLRKRDFDQLLEKSRILAQAVQDFLRQEEITSYLQQKQNFNLNKAARWVRQAVNNMEAGKRIPSASEMAETIKEHKGAPLAIWLGQLLDGIPGALVIGPSALDAHVSVSLLAGLFLSNYPASLSSSTGMQQQGFSFRWALGMWFSLMMISGVGAAVGYLFFAGASPMIFSFLEGTAVGAMMTVIAETILPEAYFKGSSLVGFSTLLGFLAAVFFKTLE